MRASEKKPKHEKFDFEKMKLAATHEDRNVRKSIFIEYFDRFEEFPSYLFDNVNEIDSRLAQTIEDLKKDPETPVGMRKAIDALVTRLSP